MKLNSNAGGQQKWPLLTPCRMYVLPVVVRYWSTHRNQSAVGHQAVSGVSKIRFATSIKKQLVQKLSSFIRRREHVLIIRIVILHSPKQ